MQPEEHQAERWQLIEQIYYAALEREAGQRATFLAEICAGDDELRREVGSLLAAYERAGNFIEAPPGKVAAQMLCEKEPASLVGRQLGPYRIVTLLGEGGMSQVYRARDTRLERDVAVKVLPAHLAENREARLRFEREAKSVAALSHPSILGIYDVGKDEGVHYAVMELLEGETLRNYLARTALFWRHAVEIGVSIAEGLQAAHAKGIVHRDLKPENIFLTSDAQVKILDFGIARVRQQRSSENSTEASAFFETRPGMVLGTVGYMSPEQVRGEKVEAPGDIFSFGCVLYEMVAGRRVLGRSTAPEALSVILRDIGAVLAATGRPVPSALARVIGQCLEEHPGDRFQSARELALDLRDVLIGGEIAGPLSLRSTRRLTHHS
jgi:serine/threonine protein kinase